MENIFRKRSRTTTSSGVNNSGINKEGTVGLSDGLDKPEILNLTKVFLKKMKTLSHVQKINLLYSNFTDKKPDPNLDITKKLNRILFEQTYGAKIKHTQKFLKGKKKFNFPFAWKNVMKKGKKEGRQILVWYLNSKGVIEPPKLYPIYSSDMIIIRNKPHQVDPRAFWDMGKFKCLLIKEIDRRPISNLDYDEIKKRGDSTDSDEFIIKAAMQAVIGGTKKKPIDKKVIIIIGVLALIAVVYFMTT